MREMMVDNLDRSVIARHHPNFRLRPRPQGVALNCRAPLLRHARKHPHPYLPPELQAGIFVKRDAVDIGNRKAGAVQAIAERGSRKRLVVLYSGEPFFLHRGDNAAVLHETAGRVVVACRNANDIQTRLPSPCASNTLAAPAELYHSRARREESKVNAGRGGELITSVQRPGTAVGGSLA